MNRKDYAYSKFSTILGLLLIFSSQGEAACTFSGGGRMSTASWNPGIINAAGKNVGDVLADSGQLNLNRGGNFSCFYQSTRTWQVEGPFLPANIPGEVNSVRANTNIPGVTIQVTSLRGDRTTVFPPSPRVQSLIPNGTVFFDDQGIIVQLKLFKSEESVGTGALLTGQIYQEFIVDLLGPTLVLSQVNLTGGTVVNSGCSVATQSLSIPVSLGLTPQTDFTGVGTASQSIPFNIELIDCSPTTNVKVTFSDTSGSPSPSIPGVLALIPGGATGVGIQLLDDANTPIPLDIPFDVGQTVGTTFSIPLKARYYQTGTTMTTGPANSTANFTMTYD